MESINASSTLWKRLMLAFAQPVLISYKSQRHPSYPFICYHLRSLIPFKVITNEHVKDKAISISQTKLLGKNMANDMPCILIECLVQLTP